MLSIKNWLVEQWHELSPEEESLTRSVTHVAHLTKMCGAGLFTFALVLGLFLRYGYEGTRAMAIPLVFGALLLPLIWCGFLYPKCGRHLTFLRAIFLDCAVVVGLLFGHRRFDAEDLALYLLPVLYVFLIIWLAAGYKEYQIRERGGG